MQLDVAAAVARVSDAAPLLQDSCRHRGKTLFEWLTEVLGFGPEKMSLYVKSKQGGCCAVPQLLTPSAVWYVTRAA
jgi:hypothetical protein